MTDKQLSTAAQAVLDAAFPAYDDETVYIATGEQHAGKIAAAALRALVSECETWEDGTYMVKSNDILEIAKELEGK